MSIRFSKVQPQELDGICAFYQRVIADMHAHGLRQWEWDVYPTRVQLERDAKAGELYRADENDHLVCAVALCGDFAQEYSRIEWHYGVKPCTLHRFAMLPEAFSEDAARRMLAFVKEEALQLGYDSLRVDICCEDERMLHLYQTHMQREAGRAFFENFGMEYVCFETPLSEACPMLPVRMHPAYRHGEMTPWGGTQIRDVYRRDIPDERTGEALEVSAIAGLESRTAQGETLPQLIERNGARLVGGYAGRDFPLLLKLLAARDSLSMQVHPDDSYALANEGKLGKTEAWVILQAEEGAGILYGLKAGVTLEQLQSALEGGQDVEPLIDRVNVQVGDVYYMPAGMVHAIGGGILLYEIQQSSDVTYRLWDFNRTNAKGEKRPLHIRQSLDVINPALRGTQTKLPQKNENGIFPLLDVPAFRLDCACVSGECELKPTGVFRILTALSSLLLSWQGDAVQLNVGDTVLLPAVCPEVTLMGVGRALIAAPPEN